MIVADVDDAVRTPFGRHGGALAGVRILGGLAPQPRRRGGGYCVAGLCVGVGQGLAVLDA